VYEVRFSKQFEKSLRKIPKQYHLKVKEVTAKLESNPFSLDIKKLEPGFKASHRLRIGNYRIFLFVNTKTKIIEASNIKRRTSQTYS